MQGVLFQYMLCSSNTWCVVLMHSTLFSCMACCSKTWHVVPIRGMLVSMHVIFSPCILCGSNAWYVVSMHAVLFQCKIRCSTVWCLVPLHSVLWNSPPRTPHPHPPCPFKQFTILWNSIMIRTLLWRKLCPGNRESRQCKLWPNVWCSVWLWYLHCVARHSCVPLQCSRNVICWPPTEQRQVSSLVGRRQKVKQSDT